MRKSLTVYCTGAPNFFIVGVTKDFDTYSLINNQYWVRSPHDLEQSDLDDMILVAGRKQINVQE